MVLDFLVGKLEVRTIFIFFVFSVSLTQLSHKQHPRLPVQQSQLSTNLKNILVDCMIKVKASSPFYFRIVRPELSFSSLIC